MRRLPLAGERADDAPRWHGPGDERIRPSGPALVVVPVDETAAIEFTTHVANACRDRGTRITVVFETESKSYVPNEALREAVARWSCASSPHELLVAASGPGPLVVVGTNAAIRLESRLVVAVTSGVPALRPAAVRALGNVLDVTLESPRPAFASYLAEALVSPST